MIELIEKQCKSQDANPSIDHLEGRTISMPTTRGMGDLAPQSEREHNYVVMFRNSPKSAALVFSRLFRSKDSTLLNFMDAFPWTRPGMKQQEQLWSSGFPIVLLEALTDNRWYESFKVNCGKFAGDDTSNSETVRWLRWHSIAMDRDTDCSYVCYSGSLGKLSDVYGVS